MGRTTKRRLNKDRVLGVGIIVAEIIAGAILIAVTNDSPEKNLSTTGSTIVETPTTGTTTVTVEVSTTTTTVVTAKPKVYFVPYDTVNDYDPRIRKI